VQAVRAADDLVERLESFEAQYRTNPASIAAMFQNTKAAMPPDPDFQFKFLDSGYGVLETKTGTLLVLPD
jgi:hypothetical protein